MERFELTLSSTGSISQILSRIGALLPMTVSTEDSIVRVTSQKVQVAPWKLTEKDLH
jgi:hypothetical protein